MDNFFGILFILFLIFSFLAPLLKKKAPQEQQKTRRPQGDDNGRPPMSTPTYSSSNSSNEEYDILKEVEAMFNKNTETKPAEESSLNKAEIEVNYESPEWHEPDKIENKIDDEWHRPTTLADFNKEETLMDEKAKAFEQLINENKKVYLLGKKIRTSIRNQETLKEYIIISEILGKPRGFEIY
jgi:hypothetical protein